MQFAVASTLIMSINPAFANTSTIQDLQTTLEENKTSQESVQESIVTLKEQNVHISEQIKAEEKKLEKLNRYISVTEKEISQKNKELEGIYEYIKQLETTQKTIETQLSEKKEAFKERAATYYKHQNSFSFFDILFDNLAFEELIGRFSSYESIVDSDRAFIDQYISDQENVIKIQEKTADLKSKVEVMKGTAEELKLSYEQAKQKQNQLLASLKKKKQTLKEDEQNKEQALRQFEKENAHITEQIQKEDEQRLLAMVNEAKNEARHPFNDSSSTPSYGSVSVNSMIQPFIVDAQQIKKERGVPASIILGQIILESSGKYNGLSGLAYEGKNLYGVKGTGTSGSLYMDTTEYVDGKKIRTKAKFAKYATYYDSMAAHADLLMKPRYQQQLRYATTIEQYARGLQKAGYATDPNYASLLINVIKKYGLQKYD